VVLGTLLRRIAADHILPGGFPNCGVVTVTWQDGSVKVGETDDSWALATG
jgi:hypothetical protein